MQLVRSLVIGSLGAAIICAPAAAADFYVKAQTPGPVSGTPLASIALQATTEATTESVTSSISTDLRFRMAAATDVTTVGKWLIARKKKRGIDGSTTSGTGTTSTTTGTSTGGTVTSGTTTDGSGGGTTTGGTTTGGTSGGTTTGGTTTGGTSGGTTTGGTTTGGTSGGTTTGGTTTGGTTTGGTTTGGTSGGGAMTGTTWPSFSALMGSGKVSAGDRIFLMDGYHGPILVKDKKFTGQVLVAPAPGQTAQVDSILVVNSSNVTFEGLKVWATSANAGTGALIRTYATASDVNFTGLDVRAVANSGNYMSWSQAEWLNNQRLGFQADGNRISITKNRVTGIYHGIQTLGANALIEDNIVDGFAGDGMRALGNNSIVRRNKVQNCFQVNNNHADAFQSFSRGAGGKPGTGTVFNLTIEDNKFFEWVSSSTNPLRCQLQGVGMFDGMYDGTIVRNNVIITRAGHGINIAGALNTQIVNNTVISALGKADRWPWIRVSPHKNGTRPQNVVIANNMATSVKTVSDPTRNILVSDNIVVTNPGAEFTAMTQFDYSLKSSSKGANTGNQKYAPADDIEGALRPKGKGPDIGAYESF